MDIINNDGINYALARSIFKDITQQLGVILRIPSASISILKPLIIPNGICVKFALNTKTYKKSKNNLTDINNELKKFGNALNDDKNKEILIKQFNKTWNLTSTTQINNINIKYIKSKNRQKNTIEIEMGNNILNTNSSNNSASNDNDVIIEYNNKQIMDDESNNIIYNIDDPKITDIDNPNIESSTEIKDNNDNALQIEGDFRHTTKSSVVNVKTVKVT